MTAARIVQWVTMAAVALVILCGLAMNVSYAATVTPDVMLVRIYIALAVATGLLKAGLAVYVHVNRRPGAGVWCLLIVVLAFEITWGLGFAAITRGEAARERAASNEDRARLVTALARAEAERTRVYALPQPPAPPRASSVVRADQDAATLAAGNCARRQHVDACKRVAELGVNLAAAVSAEGERAAWTRARDAASAVVAESERAIEGTSTTPADPGANAVGALLRGLGLPVSDDTVTRAMGVLVVLLLELTPLFGLPLALKPPAMVVAAPIVDVPPPPAPQPAQVPQAVAPTSRLIDFLATARALDGGWRHAPQRALADALGSSPAAVNRMLRQLVAAGAIAMQTSTRGTAIKVLDPALAA